MRAKCRHIVSLFLAVLFLLSCVACGQPQMEQPEDTGDKGQYMTDPIPEGKPAPVEPQDTAVDTTVTHTCIFSIVPNVNKCYNKIKQVHLKHFMI